MTLLTCSHCQKKGPRNRLHLYRNVYRGGHTVRPGRAHFLHKDCWEPFTAKQAQQADLETFVHEHKGRGWFHRLILAPTLHQKMKRLHGRKPALVSVLRWLFRKP